MKLDGLHSQYEWFLRDEKNISVPGFESGTVQSVASRYSDENIPDSARRFQTRGTHGDVTQKVTI